MGLSDCWLMYDWLNLLHCFIDDSFIYSSCHVMCWVLLFSWLSTFASSCLSICRCTCLLESFNSLIHFLACLFLASVSTFSRYSWNSSTRPSPSSVSFLFFHSFVLVVIDIYLCLLVYFLYHPSNIHTDTEFIKIPSIGILEVSDMFFPGIQSARIYPFTSTIQWVTGQLPNWTR